MSATRAVQLFGAGCFVAAGLLIIGICAQCVELAFMNAPWHATAAVVLPGLGWLCWRWKGRPE